MPVKSRKKVKPQVPCPYKGMTDEQVAQAIKDGDSMALEYLFRRYKGFIRLKTKHYFIAGAGPDDLLQEAQIGLYKAVRDFNSEKGTFRAFAELCIARQVITAIKSATRQKHAPLNHSVSINKPVYDEDNDRSMLELIGCDSSLDPLEVVLQMERSEDLRRRIHENMSSLEKEVLGYYMDGYSYQDIADTMNKRVKSIDNALQRTKRKIQINLGLTE